MAIPVLDATPGGPDSNTYVTLAEANDYMDARLHNSPWLAASNDQKTVALVMATREMDARVDWVGDRSSLTQRLDWPRTGVINRDTGVLFASDEIPEWLKAGQIEYAFVLLQADTTISASRAIDEVRTTSLHIKYGTGAAQTGLTSNVVSYIDLYVLRWHGRMVRRLVRT